MYRLTITFGPTALCWGLLYKEEHKAKETLNLATIPSANVYDPFIDVVDDFGQQVRIKQDAIIAGLLENLDDSRQAGIELVTHNGKIEAGARARLMSDRNSGLVTGLPTFNPVPGAN